MEKKQSTDWQQVNKWYDSVVGELGHYYHQQIVMPGVLKLLKINDKEPARVLDLACGQGVLSRHLPKNTYYHGVDGSKDLIKNAKNYTHNNNHHFSVGDICTTLPLKEPQPFSHATIILALQNIAEPDKVFMQASKNLMINGTLVIVLNHPYFRIPRQSNWQIDEEQKIQYRRINRYLSPLKIPIQMQPSKAEKSVNTWSFHFPLSSYVQWLNQSGFVIELIEEWTSDKTSVGRNAAMENRARQEFPLFMAIRATKIRV